MMKLGDWQIAHQTGTKLFQPHSKPKTDRHNYQHKVVVEYPSLSGGGKEHRRVLVKCDGTVIRRRCSALIQFSVFQGTFYQCELIQGHEQDESHTAVIGPYSSYPTPVYWHMDQRHLMKRGNKIMNPHSRKRRIRFGRSKWVWEEVA